MNIGIVTTWFERGAAYVSRAYLEILQKEHSVFVYVRGGEEYAKGDPEWDGPNVTFSPKLESYFVRGDKSMSRLHFAKWIRSRKISLIIFNEQRDISLVRMLSNNGFITGAYVDYYKKETVSEFDVYDFLLCNTQRHYSVFKNHKNPIFLQWGTDVELFKPKKDHLKVSENVVFFHSAGYGGAGYRKGTDLLVRAFQLVKGPAKLIIHSQASKEYYGKQISKILSEDGRIKFIEKTVKAPGLYHLGDAYVYPSRLDGIGLSVPEALSCGLPVITTNCPPMSEFVVDGKNGFLVDIDNTCMRSDGYYWPEALVNIKDLARKMQKYVDDKNLLRVHKNSARQSAELEFNWENNAKDLLNKLEEFGGFYGQTISMRYYFSFLLEDIFRFSTYVIYRALIFIRKTLTRVINPGN